MADDVPIDINGAVGKGFPCDDATPHSEVPRHLLSVLVVTYGSPYVGRSCVRCSMPLMVNDRYTFPTEDSTHGPVMHVECAMTPSQRRRALRLLERFNEAECHFAETRAFDARCEEENGSGLPCPVCATQRLLTELGLAFYEARVRRVARTMMLTDRTQVGARATYPTALDRVLADDDDPDAPV